MEGESLLLERLVEAVAVPVEERERVVEGDTHPVARVAPHQVHAKGLLVAGERQRPAVVPVARIHMREGLFTSAMLIDGVLNDVRVEGRSRSLRGW